MRGDLTVEARASTSPASASGGTIRCAWCAASPAASARASRSRSCSSSRSNLLFLDEPTNHLDIPAAEILEEALVGFEGTVLLVSHDRRFLENVTTRIIHVRGGSVDIFPAGFRDFARSLAPPPKAVAAPPPPRAVTPKKPTFEEQRQEARALERKRRRVTELEKFIAIAEKDVEAMKERLRAAPGDQWEELAKMAREEQALQRKVDAMLIEWAKLSGEVGEAV